MAAASASSGESELSACSLLRVHYLRRDGQCQVRAYEASYTSQA